MKNGLQAGWLLAAMALLAGCADSARAGGTAAFLPEGPAAPAAAEARTEAPLPDDAPPAVGTAPSDQAISPADESSSGEPPFALPDGYRIVKASRYSFAVPEDWQVEPKALHDEHIFLIDGEKAGETEILGWFDADTWRDFKPNHSDQTAFGLRDDLLAEPREDVHIYRIELLHTKPAADLDPEWKYEETRWYAAVREDGRAYGFCFDSRKVDEAVMETIVSTFRLMPGTGIATK